MRQQLPELMELSFGCRFRVKKNSKYEELGVEEGTYISLFDFEFDSEHLQKALNLTTALRIDLYGMQTTDYAVAKVVPFPFKALNDNGNIEIIGHPIQPHHWLRVLKRNQGKYLVYIDEDGECYGLLSGEHRPFHLLSFNLTTGQPATEEDYQAFCEIVGVGN